MRTFLKTSRFPYTNKFYKRFELQGKASLSAGESRKQR